MHVCFSPTHLFHGYFNECLKIQSLPPQEQKDKWFLLASGFSLNLKETVTELGVGERDLNKEGRACLIGHSMAWCCSHSGCLTLVHLTSYSLRFLQLITKRFLCHLSGYSGA